MAILVLIAVGLFLLFSPPMLLHRAHAATPIAGPLQLQAERTTSGSSERARLQISGRTPARLPAGAAVTARVLAAPVATPCPRPSSDRRGRLSTPPGATRVGWRSLSALRPGTRLGAGRAFTMVGTVALPATGQVRLCGYLVRTGTRPAILEHASDLLDRRLSAFLDPVVGRSLAATLDPVVRAVAPVVVALALLLLSLRIRRVVLARRHRRHRIARCTSSPHRRLPGTRPHAAGHIAPPAERAVTLPPLPAGVVVPDVLPASLGGRPPIVAPVEVAEAVPPPTPPRRRRGLRPGRRSRERQWQLGRALEPLRSTVDEIVALGAANGDATLVVARDGQLAFLFLLSDGSGDDLELARLAAIAIRARDGRLGGLPPIPVLVAREGAGAATVHPPHPGYPGLDVWRLPLGGLASFVLARVPGGHLARARAGRG